MNERTGWKLPFDLIILLNITVIFVVTGMCSKDGYHHISCLDILIRDYLKIPTSQRELSWKFATEIIPSDLKLKKKLAILPASVDFEEKWKLILNEAEKKLIASIETQIQLDMKDRNTNVFLREHREIDWHHVQFKHQLVQRRMK